MVGATGFEPVTTRTPSVCATRLRYAPLKEITHLHIFVGDTTAYFQRNPLLVIRRISDDFRRLLFILAHLSGHTIRARKLKEAKGGTGPGYR